MCIRDRNLAAHYNADTFPEGKAACKKDLQEQFGLQPVSYTHLDVYKRQPIICAATIFAAAIDVVMPHFPNPVATYQSASTPEKWPMYGTLSTLIQSCLLYTSRCV